MGACYTNKRELSMEYQVSTSTIPCISNQFYTIIRILFAGWTLIVFGYSIYYDSVPEFDTTYDKSDCCFQYHFLYFTFWGLTVSTIYWLNILYLSSRVNQGKSVSESCCHRLNFNFTRILFLCGLTGNIVIGAAFWALVFDFDRFDANGGLKWLIATINWHGVTTLLMIIEYVLSSFQLRLYMTIFFILYGLAYVGLLLIHYSQNWTDSTGNDRYLYSFLDFHTDFIQSLINAALLVAGAAILSVIMTMLKRIMMNTCCYDANRKNKNGIWDESREDSLPQPSAPSMASYPGHAHQEYV